MNKENEIELLITVTPELVDAMNPDEVPPCFPGSRTDVPSDCELYLKRYIEVPRCCPPGSAGTCPEGGSCPECNKDMQGAIYQDSGSGQLPGMILKPTPVETIDRPASQGQPGGVLLKPTTHKAPYLTPGARNRPGSQNMLAPQRTASRQSSPSNRYMPSNQNRTFRPSPNSAPRTSGEPKTLPGFIGPVGYDVVK